MPIGADVTPAQPAVIGAIIIGTELLPRLDRASASTGARQERWRHTGDLRVGFSGVFTGVAQRFVEESGKGYGLLGAFLDGLDRRDGCQARCGSTSEPRPIQEYAKPQQSEQQKVLVKPVVFHLVPLP
jgi:hypothetical protein